METKIGIRSTFKSLLENFMLKLMEGSSHTQHNDTITYNSRVDYSLYCLNNRVKKKLNCYKNNIILGETVKENKR